MNCSAAKNDGKPISVPYFVTQRVPSKGAFFNKKLPYLYVILPKT